MTALSSWDYGIIGAFLAVILIVGLAASRLAARNLEHYFSAGATCPGTCLASRACRRGST